MDPEINDEQTFIEDEATVREQTEAAFAEGFGSNVANERTTREKTDAKPAAAPAPAAETKPEATPDPKEAKPAADQPVDPYEGLPQAVRDRLAKVDQLEHENRTLGGRFSAMQKDFNAFKASATRPVENAPAPAKPAKRELVRGELPEVAEAMDELETRLADAQKPKPEPEPAESPAPAEPTQVAKELSKVHPDWANTLRGSDFHLWLGQQAPQYANEIRETDSAVVIAAALTKFDGFRAQKAEQQRQKDALAASRKNRVAGSEQPRAGARPAATPETEDAEEAFLAGFKARTGG